jgi:hypothetical protein
MPGRWARSECAGLCLAFEMAAKRNSTSYASASQTPAGQPTNRLQRAPPYQRTDRRPLDFDDNVALARLDVRVESLQEERRRHEAVLAELLSAVEAENKARASELLAELDGWPDISTSRLTPRGARCDGYPEPRSSVSRRSAARRRDQPSALMVIAALPP